MVAHCLSNASGNQLSELTGITPNHIITWCHTEIDIPRQYTPGLSLNHPDNLYNITYDYQRASITPSKILSLAY